MRAPLTAILLAIASSAVAAPSNCPTFFVGNQAPDFHRAELVQREQELCFSFYAVGTSGISRTALWSAERLTRESVEQAHRQKRVDAFHSEPRLAPIDRAEREDYLRSGLRLDEGHMAPSGDMPDANSQYESFSLANMIPQDADDNRHLWQGVEIAVRSMARYEGVVYVVTGPAFIGPRAVVGGRVMVPTHVWKAVYSPKRGAAAYVARNQPGDEYSVVSIVELTRVIGIDPFPAVPANVKASAIGLPTPRPSGQKLSRGPVPADVIGFGQPGQVSTLAGPFVSMEVQRPRRRHSDFAEQAEREVARAVFRSLTR